VNNAVNLPELGETPGYFLLVVPPSPEELRRTHKLLDQILETLAEIRVELAETLRLEPRPDGGSLHFTLSMEKVHEQP
jgi:hypothetical protein